jgi:N5-(carboxyethyl)ornithine synthase
MKEVGFVKTSMPEEARVALLPKDIQSHVNNPEKLFFEKDYAKHLGVNDSEYIEVGANVVSRIEAYNKEVLCIPKPWIDDIEFFKPNQIIMGWLYLAEKKKISEAVLKNNMTAIAWENMYGPNKEYAFEKNRWYAGYIATTQGLPFAKASPKKVKIAVLGNGRVAQGVFARLNEEGANYETFGTNILENLDEVGPEQFKFILKTFKSRIHEFDVVINCWYYDPAFGNYISLEDLQEMQEGSLFIDVTSDGVEGSIPHPIISPFYKLGRFNPIIVYNNSHAPSYWALDSSETISESLAPFIDKIIKEEKAYMLDNATVVDKGKIVDKRINTLLEIDEKK